MRSPVTMATASLVTKTCTVNVRRVKGVSPAVASGCGSVGVSIQTR